MLTSAASISRADVSSSGSHALPVSTASVFGAVMALGATPPKAISTSSATQSPVVRPQVSEVSCHQVLRSHVFGAVMALGGDAAEGQSQILRQPVACCRVNVITSLLVYLSRVAVVGAPSPPPRLQLIFYQYQMPRNCLTMNKTFYHWPRELCLKCDGVRKVYLKMCSRSWQADCKLIEAVPPSCKPWANNTRGGCCRQGAACSVKDKHSEEMSGAATRAAPDGLCAMSTRMPALTIAMSSSRLCACRK